MHFDGSAVVTEQCSKRFILRGKVTAMAQYSLHDPRPVIAKPQPDHSLMFIHVFASLMFIHVFACLHLVFVSRLHDVLWDVFDFFKFIDVQMIM